MRNVKLTTCTSLELVYRVMEDSSPSSSLYDEISRLLTKTADSFEKMAKRAKFSDSESGTAATESDNRRKSKLVVVYLVYLQPF